MEMRKTESRRCRRVSPDLPVHVRAGSEYFPKLSKLCLYLTMTLENSNMYVFNNDLGKRVRKNQWMGG